MSKIIKVQGIDITITQINDQDYISLTDMMKSQDGDFFIADWLRNKNTLEFLSVWESIHNPNFNYGEFAVITNRSALNSFKISVKEWVGKTGAIGITAKTGKYGGTYAHKDIAFEFGTWLSPKFKLYLITEFQRLKEAESNVNNIEWNVRRVLSKVNYHLQTSAVKEYRIPNEGITKDKEWIAYAEEADILNYAIFGFSAKQWREANPELHLRGNNVRDFASINELSVMSSMESMNSVMIKSGMSKRDRATELRDIAQQQLKMLNHIDYEKTYRRTIDGSFQNHISKSNTVDQPIESEEVSLGKTIKKTSKADRSSKEE